MSSVAEQTAEWLLRLEEETDNQALQAEFQQWLARDPAHAATYGSMQAMITGLAEFKPQAGAAHQAIQAGFRQDKRRKQIKRISSTLALLLVLALPAQLVMQHAPLAYWLADMRTATAQWQSAELPDHSQITLNGHTAVDLDFTSSQRTLTLIEGEILVDVAKDASRPFVVKTDHGSVTALGTRFVVSRHAQSTDVQMLESKVRAMAAAQPAATAVIQQGQGVNVTSDSLGDVFSIDPASISDAWAMHQLVVQDQPLSDVLAIIGRHHAGYLRFDASAVAHYRVSAVLPLDDPERALALLAESFPLELQKFTPWVVSVNIKP